MMGRPRAIVAAVLAGTLVASPALAQPNEKQRMGGDLIKRAIAKSQEGDHLGAIDLYLQAYTLLPGSHTILSNVGSEYQQADKPVEALKYFCKYLEVDPAGTNATYATAKAKALQIELGNKVDEKNVCKPILPKPDKVPEKPDEQPERPLPPPPPPGGGSPLRWVGLGVAGVGAVGLAAGIFFGVKAQKDSDFISDYRQTHPGEPWPDDIHDIEDRGQSYENKQILFDVAGGVLLATGLVVFIVGQTSGKGETTVRPTASQDGAGVVFGGRF